MEIKRIISKTIENCLKEAGALLITGPKFCGKTFVANKASNSKIMLYDIDTTNDMTLNKLHILDGEFPRLIDEWQEYPKVWDWVRNKVDELGTVGCYILTGSTRPIEKLEIKHSGAGRFIKVNMQTLTFAEILKLDENNSVSLQDLFDNKEFKPIKNSKSIEQVSDMLIKGGWPLVIAEDLPSSSNIVKWYSECITTIDTKKLYNLNADKRILKKIMVSMCRLSGTQMNKSTILKDLNDEIHPKTLNKYIEMLYEMETIFDVDVWDNFNIRSSYKIRTKPKTYICDTSLIASNLEIFSSSQFFGDLRTLGIVFENQVMKDLKVYIEANGGELYYYRDEKGNEIDAIVKWKDGRWGAIEIKLSDDDALIHSEKLLNVIKTLKMEGKNKEPSFVAIINNGIYAYKMENGVYVIPHTLLRE